MTRRKKEGIVAFICLLLSAIILFSTVSSYAMHITAGETVDCNAGAENYNAAIPDTTGLYTGITTKENLQAEIDELDKLLAAFIDKIDIEEYLYTDEVASLVTKYSAILTETALTDITYTALSKKFPEAYEFIRAKQEANCTWDDITTIPFGIEEGDKNEFLKACGAGAEHLGNGLLKVIMYEPTSYTKALVPALESTHTGEMPSIVGFVMQTGLSGSKRVEFLLDRVLKLIKPVKKAPLTFLCGMLPDFIINYSNAANLINSNENIKNDVKLQLPTIESIVSGLIDVLGVTAPPLDYNYLASLGSASVGHSGANEGNRVVIDGDREAIFQYLADYITGIFVYENNFEIVEDIFMKKIKSIENEEIKSLLYSDALYDIFSQLLYILSNDADTAKDIEALTSKYNSNKKDYSELFGNRVTSRENVSSLIDNLDKIVADEIENLNIEKIVYTDTIATIVAKFTADLCSAELSEIDFKTLKKEFPEAYAYVAKAKEEGKTWDDIDVIPFGITSGDKAEFIKACGAGGEHFGDVLALCVMVSPTSYDDALVPIFESLHTGAMPGLKEFVGSSGLNGAKRVEDIATKIISILKPISETPVSYLCEILPDLVMSYNSVCDFVNNDEYLSLTGLKIKPLEQFIGELLSDMGIQLPDQNLPDFDKMGEAKTEASGDSCGFRMSLYGDREVVFMSLFNYIMDVVEVDGNLDKIVSFASDLLDININLTFVTEIFNTVKKFVQTRNPIDTSTIDIEGFFKNLGQRNNKEDEVQQQQ